MGTVFRSARQYRVTVHSNDHAPPHVHAKNAELDARFKLNCPSGPVEIMGVSRGWKQDHLNELGEEIGGKLADCCAKWSEIHGEV